MNHTELGEAIKEADEILKASRTETTAKFSNKAMEICLKAALNKIASQSKVPYDNKQRTD